MRGYLIYLFELKKRRMLIGLLIDVIAIIGNISVFLFIKNTNVGNLKYGLLIFTLSIFIMGIYNFSWYFTIFYEIKKEGFLLICNSLANGLKRMLRLIFVVSEFMLVKVYVFFIIFYKVYLAYIKDFLLEDILDKFSVTNNFIICIIMLNIYLMISMLISSCIKDKSLVYLLANILTTVVCYFGVIKNIELWNNDWVKVISIAAVIAVFFGVLEGTVRLMKRGEIIAEKN